MVIKKRAALGGFAYENMDNFVPASEKKLKQAGICRMIGIQDNRSNP